MMDLTSFIASTKKRKFSLLLTLIVPILVLFGGFSTLHAQSLGIRTVVIDPGHGGKDPGAIGGAGLKEKDVALFVSLELGKKIKAKYPDVKVHYTRSDDRFITLSNRAKKANDLKADLFISVHANAAKNKAAYGTESWVLGLHKSEAELEVAKRENSSILLEDDHKMTYENFDPNSPESYIRLAMRQNAYLKQSADLAFQIQKHFVDDSKRKSRGVKQAGFLVLYKTTMPSVLIELGFLSNTTEEAFLKSKSGKLELTESIFKAFVSYKEQVDGIDAAVMEQGSTPVENKTEKSTNPELEYRVQLAASKKKVEIKSYNFKGLIGVDEYISNGYYKYTYGRASTFEGIQGDLKTAKEKYPDAYVVAFHKGKPIAVKEARKLETKQ